MEKETLAQYITRIMEEKDLQAKEVEERSGGAITDSYVADIAGGKRTNPTVSKLQALAVGLDVDEDELFLVARGYSSHKPDELWSADELLNAMGKVNTSPEVARALKGLLKMKPNQLKALLATIESKAK